MTQISPMSSCLFNFPGRILSKNGNNNITSLTKSSLVVPQGAPTSVFLEPCRSFAARKGTRTRKAKKVVKKEEVKKVFMFRQLRKQAL